MSGLSENTIHILPPEVANRIAAGEVVERPASVVRELLDNALDAGATRIEVEARNGGLDGLRVRDNGSGMSPQDAALCIKRHATSKIIHGDDLDSIRTKGFRGEALAAISAVSKFEVRSRRDGDELGTSVRVEGGFEKPVENVGTPVGTTVSIDELFFNTPARRKFLKKPSTELSHIVAMVHWHALANERVHFLFSHNGNRSLDFPPVQSRAERIQQIFGASILEEMIPVTFDSPVVSISGMVSRPTLTRNGAQHLFFFVNDRYVKDRLLHRAVMNGYRNLLPTGRYPVVFLFYDISPAEIDVNVHPTKQEIKFSREDAIFSATYGLIRDAWDKREEAKQETRRIFDRLEKSAPPQEKPAAAAPAPLRQPYTAPAPQPSAATPPPRSVEAPPAAHTDSPAPAPLAQQESPGPLPAVSSAPETEPPNRDPIEHLNRRPVQPPLEDPAARRSADAPLQRDQSAIADLTLSNPKLDEHVTPISLEGLEPLTVRGQVMNCYIVAESGEGMFIIDQHAAHERLKFEEFLEQSKKASIASQVLLVPLTVELSADEVILLEEHAPILDRLGFEVEEFGPQTYVIRALPSHCTLDDAETFLKDVLGEIQGEGSVAEKQERALHTMACRAAVKFGDPLTDDDMTNIVRGLETIPRRNVCPHGRPAILYLNDANLRKLFKRTGFD